MTNKLPDPGKGAVAFGHLIDTENGDLEWPRAVSELGRFAGPQTLR